MVFGDKKICKKFGALNAGYGLYIIQPEFIVRIQLGVLMTIITAALFCGGFYYTTQLRLDSLETQVKILAKKVKKSPKKIRPKGVNR